jgi:hypothetical protein
VQTMFIVRLLNAQREILAWNRVPAETRGDGGLWPMQNFVAEVEQTGVATAICFHWPDLHCYTTEPLTEHSHVTAGQVFTVPLLNTGKPMIHIASEAAPLPPITVRSSVTVGIGTGRG